MTVDLTHLRAGHPRLLITDDDIARIKAAVAADPAMRLWYLGLQRAAQSLLTAPVSRYEIPDGLRLLATSRRVLDRIYTLALMYRLDGDVAYAERAWRELEAAAAFPDWNPRHFLDTAEMTHAFAIGYDWFYDVWTDAQRESLRQAMIEKGLTPALMAYRGTAPSNWSWWVRATHNWNLVCNGGIAMGALAIADAAPELAQELLESGIASVPLALNRFAPDGGWDEGVGYWHYSIRYLVPYLAALQSALGTDFGLSQTPGLAEAGTFPISLVGPTGMAFNFADSGTGAPRAPEMFWLARRFGRPAFAWWQRQVSGERGSPLHLLWYDPKAAEDFDPNRPAQGEGLPLDRHFRGVEVASLRSAWADPEAVFVAFKAGDNTANHGDLDMGSFVLDALGVRWAEELGSDDYNLPGYFGSGRWDYYRKRTEGQNTLVINPSDDPGQDPLARARIIHFASRPGEAVAIADLTPAYRRDAVRVQRGIALLDQRRQVLIQDEIETRSPSEIWWFMHTRADVRLGADGRTALLERNGRRLSARILSPAEASFTVMEARPLPTSPDPAGQNPNSEVRKLAIRLDDVTKTTLAVQLVPLADEAFAPVPPELIPLEAWASAAGPDGLWPTLPRMAMRITSPPAGEAVHGRVPLGIDVELPEGLSLERVTVHLDEQVVYSGSGLPDGVALDTRTVADGPHRLTVTAALRGGGIAVEVVELMVQNTWSLRDPLEAPIDAGWFGTIDRTMSSAESGGWTYVGDDAAGLFGDESRKVRREDTQEWIVWETPHLKTFSVRLYARTEAIDPLVALAASADGEHWRALPYDVTLERAEGGWYALSLEGSTPSGRDPRWFRITLLPGELPADDIQIGQVELSGQHD